MTTLFGSDKWAEAVAIADGQERMRFLHDLFYAEMKDKCGLRYVRSFEIVTAARNSGYHLFFGTNHEVGLEKMKQVMWAVDPIAGKRFKDSTNAKSYVLFEPEPDLAPLREALRKQFGRDPFSIEAAVLFTLVDTPYLPKHLKRPILKPLEKKGELEVVSAKDGRRRGTYPDGTVVRFV